MSPLVVASRDAAIEVLTTHRHGEERKPCRYCADYYGELIDKLTASGVARTVDTPGT